MTRLTEITRYDEAQAAFSKEKLWELFDGDRDHLNIAYECLDRHDPDRTAINIIDAGHDHQSFSFGELTIWSNRFANFLISNRVAAGARVALMLEPSLIFYAALFGAMKANCVAVPLFTLFGPDGIKLRLDDCDPAIFLAQDEHIKLCETRSTCTYISADDEFLSQLAKLDDKFDVDTRSDDMAMYQYTSGTTRELPDAIKHRHRAIVTVMIAALYGTGIRPEDNFCCPSSPAWGHGLWHGTLAPLAMGTTITSYRGRFDATVLLEGLNQFGVTNLSAAATHYRMMRAAYPEGFDHHINKLSFTGEPIDSETATWAQRVFGTPVCSMYGTTEVGVILVSYPGAADFLVKPGSLGKPVPGIEVRVVDQDHKPTAPGERGEIVVKRRDGWFPTKDLGYIDEDHYFYHAGRADDVIISAGWTMSAVEIEDVILKHPEVKEVAVVASPDQQRGHIPKAFVVSDRCGGSEFINEIVALAKTQLAQHEYPRAVEFVSELPKLPAGKINRKRLREIENQKTKFN